MADEETKEKTEAMLVKVAEDELVKKTSLRDQFQARKKDSISQMKQFQDEVKKMERLKEELMRQNAQAEEDYREKKGGKENKHQDKEIKPLTIGKERLYESFLNSNFYEFGKIRTMFENKEKERAERINREQYDSSYVLESKKTVKQQVEGDYAKPIKPVVSVTYMKPNWIRDAVDEKKGSQPVPDNGQGVPNPPIVSEAVDEEGETVTQPDAKETNSNIMSLSKYITTFRVAKDSTKIEELVRKSMAFWGIRGKIAFLDFEKQEILGRTKSVTFETESKQPSFYIYNTMIGVEKFLNAEDDTTKKDEVGVEEKGSDDFESLFMKYLYQLKTFFVIEPPNKAKTEKESKTKMNDYHPGFIMTIFFLVIFSAFSILMFYAKNESTMKSGFANILTKYRTKTVYYIQDFDSLLDYIEYLGSEEFRQTILKNFKFLGMLTVRQVRTKQRTCDMHGYRKDRLCYELQYTDTTKFYAPIAFSLANGTTDYYYYTTQEQTRIHGIAQGLYSQYDGSGYYVAFDHNFPDFLASQLARFTASKKSFIQDNTRAIIIDFNLHYPVMNVNVTSQILFEISPMGDVVVNKIKNELFVLDYSRNRFALYLIDIGLHIFNFIFLFLFVMIIMNLQRDQFLDYCLSKEGITNWVFSIVSLMALIVFILMMNTSGEILNKRRSSQDYIFYFNDFSSYITYYKFYKMLKAIAICVQLIRFSFLISQSRRGRMFIVAVKKIGDKFIFVLLINFGVLAAFTIMYTYGVGMYFQLMNSITKSFVVVLNMTLRNSLFDDLTIFDGFTFILFIASYLMLISIVGVFLQIIFTDAVRNVFIEYENHVLHSDSLTLAQRIQLVKSTVAKVYQSVKKYFAEQLEKMKSNRVETETSERAPNA